MNRNRNQRYRTRKIYLSLEASHTNTDRCRHIARIHILTVRFPLKRSLSFQISVTEHFFQVVLTFRMFKNLCTLVGFTSNPLFKFVHLTTLFSILFSSSSLADLYLHTHRPSSSTGFPPLSSALLAVTAVVLLGRIRVDKQCEGN